MLTSIKGGDAILCLVSLAGVGLGLGIAISSSGILKKGRISRLELNAKASPEAVRDRCKEDIISGLPDDVLCSILSQLSKKDAVRTSALSRRWRILYVFLPQMSLPKISLNCLCGFKTMPSDHHYTCSPPYRQRFSMVMNRLLQLAPGYKIMYFQLSFCRLGREFMSHLERWMYCVARLFTSGNMPSDKHCSCGPQYKQRFLTVMDQFFQLAPGYKITSFQLSFCLGSELINHLEHWMHCISRLGIEELLFKFSCNDFVVKVPGNNCITELITFPFQLLSEAPMLRSLHLFACNLEPNFQGPFRSLVSLRLDAIPLVNGEVQSILSSCPKLESLTLTFCGLPSKLFIGGSELELKFLTITSCFGVEEIALCAGNLTTLETVCCNKIKVSPSNAPKLQQVFSRLNCARDMRYIIGDIAKEMPQVESLYVESMISEVYYLPLEMPSFSNIRQLYLLMDFEDIFDVQQLASLIEVCPLLQRFHLVTKGGPRYPIRLTTLSPIHHGHLKEVEYGGFYGLENEIQFVLFLLGSAASLEQMVITKDYRYYIGGGKWEKSEKAELGLAEKLEVVLQLLNHPIASNTARVCLR